MTFTKGQSSAAAGPKRLANDPRVALPRMPKKVVTRQPGQPTPSSPRSPASSQDNKPAAVNGVGIAGQLGSLQLSGQAGTFQPRSTQDPYYKALLENSQPEDAASVIVTSKGKAPCIAKSQSPIGTRPEGNGSDIAHSFTTDIGCGDFVGGHYIMITGIKDLEDYDDGMDRILTKFNVKWIIIVYDSKLSLAQKHENPSTAFIAFDDIRDVEEFAIRMDDKKSHWQYKHVAHRDYDEARDSVHHFHTRIPYFAGQVRLECRPEEGKVQLKPGDPALTEGLINLARQHGEVLAFTALAQDHAGQLHYRVEYFKLSQAHCLMRDVIEMNPVSVGGYLVISMPFSNQHSSESDDDTSHLTTSSTDTDTITSPTGRTAWGYGPQGKLLVQKPTQVNPRMSANGGFADELPYQPGQQVSVLPQGFAPQGYQSYNGSQAYHRHQAQAPMPAAGGGGRGGGGGGYRRYTPLHNYWGRSDYRDPNVDRSTEPQFIHLSKVYNGQDVRTTIMLRNMPNEWTCHDLKALLDSLCAGQYDFSYLRMDFSRNTNVSYGFMNFTDAVHIGHFLQAMQGKEWQPGLRPIRMFEVSYATIQGLDCLIEKFRNSSVMSEYPDFRPKLWYVSTDAPTQQHLGHEKPFPRPNNASKNQRSHDNAGTVGLFAPRSSQRANQSRRSQYDRGTQHQLEEDAWLNQNQSYTTAAPPPGPGYYGPPVALYQQPQYFPAPPFHPNTMPPPYGMQYYQAGPAYEDMVPRAFSAGPSQQVGSAVAPRSGAVGRGQAEMRRYQ